jgi:hypothetical protein
MKRIVNVLLYLSAFLPMLAIMWIKEVITLIVDVIKNYNETAAIAGANAVALKFDWSALFNTYLFVELGVIVIIALSLILLMRRNNKAAVKIVKIKSLKNQVAEYYLSYFSLFVLALIGFSLVSIKDVISLCLLIWLLGVVYIRNGMFYMNPSVNILKSFIYEIDYEENGNPHSRIVISKEKLHIDEMIKIYQSKYEFTLLKERVIGSESERKNG